jgi:hypothetical protein
MICVVLLVFVVLVYRYRSALAATVGRFEASPYAYPPARPPVAAVEAWAACTNAWAAPPASSSSADSDHDPLFLKAFKQFLDAAPYAPCAANATLVRPSSFARDVAWVDASDPGRGVKALRVPIAVRASESVQGRIKATRDLRALFLEDNKDSDSDVTGMPIVKGFAWSYYFLFSDRDSILWPLVANTLVFAGLAVLGTLVAFGLPAWDVARIGVCVLVIDGCLLVWDGSREERTRVIRGRGASLPSRWTFCLR